SEIGGKQDVPYFRFVHRITHFRNPLTFYPFPSMLRSCGLFYLPPNTHTHTHTHTTPHTHTHTHTHTPPHTHSEAAAFFQKFLPLEMPPLWARCAPLCQGAVSVAAV